MARTQVHIDSIDFYRNTNRWLEHPLHDSVATSIAGWGPVNADPPFPGESYFENVFQSTNDADHIRYVLDSTSATWVMTAFYRKVAAPETNFLSFWDDAGGTKHVYMRAQADGSIDVYRGDDVLLGSSGSGVLIQNQWQAIEVLVHVDDVAGVVKVRVDSTLVIDLTAVDTRNGGTAQIDRFECGRGASWGHQTFWTASTQATIELPGEVRVRRLAPATDASIAYTRSVGADSSDLIDEVGPNDSDYVESSTVNAKDKYNLDSFPGTGGILGVEAVMRHLKTDAGARTARILVEVNATDYESADKSPAVTAGYAFHGWQQNPDDAADWEAADIDGADWGFKVQG